MRQKTIYIFGPVSTYLTREKKTLDMYYVYSTCKKSLEIFSEKYHRKKMTKRPTRLDENIYYYRVLSLKKARESGAKIATFEFTLSFCHSIGRVVGQNETKQPSLFGE